MRRRTSQLRKSTVGVALVLGGLLSMVVAFYFGWWTLPHRTVRGKLDGRVAAFVDPSTRERQTTGDWVVSWGLERMRQGERVTVILFPDGPSASTWRPWSVVSAFAGGGVLSVATGYVMLRFLIPMGRRRW